MYKPTLTSLCSRSESASRFVYAEKAWEVPRLHVLKDINTSSYTLSADQMMK